MRIGIDARMYGPRQGGLGRYIEQLIKHLEQLTEARPDFEFIIFLRKNNWDEYSPANPSFQKVLADIPWYGWREQISFKKIIKSAKIDLMHFPHWNVPFFYNDPFVVTIHDLLLLHYPTRAASRLGPFTYWFKNLAFKLVLQHAVRRATHILAPCEFTKADIIKTLAVPANQITVSLLGLSNLPASTNTDIGAKYHITKPYVLYVGVAFPHKNLDGLLRAWKIFLAKYSDKYQLVLAGKKNYFYETLAKSELAANLGDAVVFTDFVPDTDLPNLFHNAALYVFPSLYEGFGLPPLEAMAQKVPVASSNYTCLPEILQDAAAYFDPKNYPQMAETIDRALTDQNLRQKLGENAQKVIHNYSWENTAKITWEIYQKGV